MEISVRKFPGYDGDERCYVHARGLIMPDGFGIITTQKLELSGIDVFYGIEIMKTYDGGVTFTEPVMSKTLVRRYLKDGSSVAICDCTPFYHKATGKIIITGHLATYGPDNELAYLPECRRCTAYAVYNEATGDFDDYKLIELPCEDRYDSSGAGCSQICELPSGDILVPIYYRSMEEAQDIWASCSKVSVLRCSFDGENMRLVEIGNEMSTTVLRGLGEPSVIKYGDEYMLTIRNDETGYVTKSTDGLHYEPIRELSFDNGENLGNYNTQQHWLVGGGKLWLVYTRRAGFNDRIFRHRAPLFIAEFDPKGMCVIRDTEREAVPMRGARLGNFGVQSYSDEVGYVFVSEWMQGIEGLEGCRKYGSDNSIFISEIKY